MTLLWPYKKVYKCADAFARLGALLSWNFVVERVNGSPGY